MAQVLKAKYYPTEHFLEAKPKQQTSYTWKSIKHANWVLKKGCYWTIGNGESTNIWDDNWLHQKGNSKTWSPKPDNSCYTKVKDIMSNNYQIWDEPLVQQLFHPQEAQKILQISIVDKAQPDSLTWDGTPDGNYTVRAGYQAIMEWKKTLM